MPPERMPVWHLCFCARLLAWPTSIHGALQTASTSRSKPVRAPLFRDQGTETALRPPRLLIFHRTAPKIPGRVAVLDRLALVVLLLSLRQSDLKLGEAI